MTDEEHGSDAPPPEPHRPPSVWPAFVAFVVVIAAALVAQLAAGFLIGVWYVLSGGNADRLAAEVPDLLASTPVVVTLTLVTQLAILATAVVAARLAPVLPRAGLGFRRSALPVWSYPALAVGSLVPFALAVQRGSSPAS